MAIDHQPGATLKRLGRRPRATRLDFGARQAKYVRFCFGLASPLRPKLLENERIGPQPHNEPRRGAVPHLDLSNHRQVTESGQANPMASRFQTAQIKLTAAVGRCGVTRLNDFDANLLDRVPGDRIHDPAGQLAGILSIDGLGRDREQHDQENRPGDSAVHGRKRRRNS